MICEMCGDVYELRNKHGGHPKTRPICGKRRCNNLWTYRAKKSEYQAKKRAGYYRWKAEKPQRLRDVNRKAAAKYRFGIEDREKFIREAGGKCSNCGEDKNLVIHHIDGMGRNSHSPNNQIHNLKVVCQGCHVAHHVWGRKLK